MSVLNLVLLICGRQQRQAQQQQHQLMKRAPIAWKVVLAKEWPLVFCFLFFSFISYLSCQ